MPDDRVRAWTLWEGWHGYDVKKYQEALREAFEAFEHFVVLRNPPCRAALRPTELSATPVDGAAATSTFVQPPLLDF